MRRVLSLFSFLAFAIVLSMYSLVAGCGGQVNDATGRECSTDDVVHRRYAAERRGSRFF